MEEAAEGSFGSGPVTVTAPTAPPPFEAAALEAAAEIDLYLAEAKVASPARAAPLLFEAGHLRESALRDAEGALPWYRDALALDATFVAALAPVRRLLAARGSWNELAVTYETAIRAGVFGTDAGRSRRVADLWIERGRLLADRLSRTADAASSFREAATAAPEYAAAQLARLIGAARATDESGLEAALAGLIECADGPARSAALAAELARVQRLSASAAVASPPVPSGDAEFRAGGAERALETLREALVGAVDETPRAGLVDELERLARDRAWPRIQVGALEELARVHPRASSEEGRGAVVALHRERARLLRDVIRDLEAAHAALAEARRLLPDHPLLTTDMLDIADQLGRVELLQQTLEDSAIPQDELLSAARLVDALGRSGRAGEAIELSLKYAATWSTANVVPAESAGEVPAESSDAAAGASSAAPSAVALLALASRVALHAEAGDAIGLADVFEAEGEQGQGEAAAHAFVRAATLRDQVLHDARHAESLYRKALERCPGYPPAVDALEEMLRVDARWADLAQVLERDLVALGPAPEDAGLEAASAAGAESSPGARSPLARRRYLLEALVGLYRDRLGRPGRALVFQRQRVSLDSDDLDGWMLQRDLELWASVTNPADAAGDQAPGDPGVALRREGVTTLISLAARAGQPAVMAALENEAAALVVDDPSLAEQFYRDAAVNDRTGIAAGHIAARLSSPAERARALAAELAAADAGGRTDVARGLRHRLAVERARTGEWREAVAVLAPVWSAGDEGARAFSFDRARLSGDPALEVLVLGEDATTAGTAGLVSAADLGEALERSGNGDGARKAFREVLQRGRSPDAAVGLLRTASVAGDFAAVTDALRAIGDMSFDDSGASVGAAATRDAELLAAARGEGAARVTERSAADADDAFGDWIEGVRRADQRQVASALIDLSRLACAPASLGPGAIAPEAGRLLARAVARSRLAGRETAEAIHRRAWAAAAGNAAVAQSISDVRMAPAGTEANLLPDTRADRAAHLPAGSVGLAIDLDIERAVEHEAAGNLGEALDVYARILARDPESLEAMLGVRRLARAGGDPLGEARALARLGALVKTPAHAAQFFGEAGPLYERANHKEQAIAVYLKVLEHAPDDEDAFARVAALLRAAPHVPGNAKTLDRVLGHRLQRREEAASTEEMIALYAERAANRLERLEDRENAALDWKRILKVDPRHERALREIASLAIAMNHAADAAHFLTRYLDVTRDEAGAAAARLELGRAHEQAGDRTRAIEALRSAVAAQPRDTVPWQRLTDLYLRAGDWRNAVASLRSWEAVLDDPTAKAGLHLRLGALLRDQAYDLPEAALAFRRAAELDPLGHGIRELALLHESAGDEAGRAAVMEHAIAEARGALDRDPFDVARLRGLKQLLDTAWRDRRGREASQAVAQALALVGAPPDDLAEVPPALRPVATSLPGNFWSALIDPPALGFMTEVWLLLADAVIELNQPDVAALGAVRGNRVAPESDPALGWLVQAGAALGVQGMILHRAPPGSTAVGPDDALALELPAPALVLGAPTGMDGGTSPFAVGRALGLLRFRATTAARLTAGALQGIFDAAAVIAGAPANVPGVARAPEAQVKALSRALARKERKTLALQASRFGFETIDAAAWQGALLRGADRLGLVLAGDVRAAAIAAGRFTAPPSPAELRRNAAATAVVRFALGEAYLAARREAGQGGT